MEIAILLVSIVGLLFAIVYSIIKLIEFINYSDSPFIAKAIFFISKMNKNNKSLNYKIHFKDLFFLTLEDYLNHYYLLKPWKKITIRNYILENISFENIVKKEENVQDLVKEVLVAHFMEKKSYATGKSWIVIGQYDLSRLENAARKAFAKANESYPLNIIE